MRRNRVSRIVIGHRLYGRQGFVFTTESQKPIARERAMEIVAAEFADLLLMRVVTELYTSYELP